MNTQLFSARSCIRFGWETFKKRPWFFIGFSILLMIAYWIMGLIYQKAALFPVNVITYLIYYAVSLLLGAGIVAFALKAHDNPLRVQIRDLWYPQHYVQFAVASIITTIVTLIGFVFLIVPGIILAIILSFAGYLVIDRKSGAIEAIKESVRLTKGYRWGLFRLIVLEIAVVLLGVICLFVGLLVAIPVALLGAVHAYRIISGAVQEAPEVEEPEPSPVMPIAAIA